LGVADTALVYTRGPAADEASGEFPDLLDVETKVASSRQLDGPPLATGVSFKLMAVIAQRAPFARGLFARSVVLMLASLPLGCGGNDPEEPGTNVDPVDMQPTPPPPSTPVPTPAATPVAEVPPPLVRPIQPTPELPKLNCANPLAGINCDDGSACNGLEQCAPSNASADANGCVKGNPIVCATGSTCTAATGQCSSCSTTSDADGDGHLSTTCGGDDCDDTSADRHPGRAELCDGVDNDCSGAIDDGASSSCSAPQGGTASCSAGACKTACNVAGQVTDGATCFAPGSCVGVTSCGAGSCVATLDSYQCSCPEGYTGSGTQSCVDVDECATNNGGCAQLCNNAVGASSCECSTGFALAADGKGCTALPPTGNPCDGITACLPGECVAQGQGYDCVCPQGYTDTGSACVDTDECALANGGCADGCANEPGSFRCSCSGSNSLGADGFSCRPFAWGDASSIVWRGVGFSFDLAMNDDGVAALTWSQADSMVGVGCWGAVSYPSVDTGRFVWQPGERIAGMQDDGSVDFYSTVYVDGARDVTALWTNRAAEGRGDALWTRDWDGSWGYHSWAVAPRQATQLWGATLFGNRAGAPAALWQRDGQLQVSFAHKDFFYNTWSTPKVVAQPSAGSLGYWTSAAMDKAGAATVAWLEGVANANGVLRYSRSLSDEVWTPAAELDPGHVSPPGRAPVVVADRAGGTHILWQRDNAVHHTKVTADGLTTGVVDLPYSGNIASQPQDLPLRAAAGNFNVTAIWGVGRVEGGSKLVATSWAPSGHWLEPVAVSEDAQEVLQAEVALEPSGRGLIVYLVMGDRGGELWGRYINGTTLDAPVRINDEWTPAAFFKLAMDAKGRVVVAYGGGASPTKVWARRFD
jgi:Putative metal-binding motif/Complement Clr-like EGF-like